MTQYRVTIQEIVVEADDERQAALEAYKQIGWETPLTFEVKDPASTNNKTVTLGKEEADDYAGLSGGPLGFTG